MYQLTAALLKKLYGSTVETISRSGAVTRIVIPVNTGDWPRKGAEAYGLKVHLHVHRASGIDIIPAFLKLFITEVPERESRTRFLIDSGLSRSNDYYHGVPFGWLGKVKINGIDTIAHFTRMIPGPYTGGPEDFLRLRTTGRWGAFSTDQRRRFAAEICVAVAGLEQRGIVHGDISPGNILIGTSKGGSPLCILCDYDGFNHSNVRRLPRKANGMACRPLGSPGYQYPELIHKLTKDTSGTSDIYVETDRFALGVAICEMMVWNDNIEKYLEQTGRGHLISEASLTSRSTLLSDDSILNQFPDGFKLLHAAAHASSVTTMPGPEDWLRILGFGDTAVPYKGRPGLSIYGRSGNSRRKLADFRIVSARGNVSDSNIVSFSHGTTIKPFNIGWRLNNKILEIVFEDVQNVKRRRNSRLTDVNTQVGIIFANPNDIFYCGEYEYEFSDIVDMGRPISSVQP